MSKLVEELRKYVELKRSSTMRVTRTEAVELLAHIERLEQAMSEQLRKEFEAWAEDYGHDISRSETNPDEYHDLITELAFDVWKSAHGEGE